MTERKVRVLLGTRKGTYIVESDARRRNWKVRPVSNAGREVYHVTADPRFPGRLYAAVNSGFWGPILYRSPDWGKRWEEVATPLTQTSKERPDPTQAADPSKIVYPVTNLWHVAPGHADEPSTVFIGVDPHMLFRSDDGAKSWQPVEGLNHHPTKPKWNPGAGGPCVHTVIVDPRSPKRMYVGISAAGTFRSDDGGEHWRATNRKVEAGFLPDPYPEVGQCVHHVSLDPANPNVAYRQDHGGIYVSRDAMDDDWDRVGKLKGGPKDDFGFCVTTARALPGKAFFVPLAGESRTTPGGALQVWEWSEKGRRWRRLLSPETFPGDFGVHREGISADTLDSAGLYVGTTTGQLFVSPDAGKSWRQVPYAFPGIHSVEAAV